MSSIVVVGAPVLIQWKYTALVTKYPQTVDIRISPTDGVQDFHTEIINGLDVSSSQGMTGYIWNVAPFADGSYRVRILPDGKVIEHTRSNAHLICFYVGNTWKIAK
jgi:hypothetical protein